MQRLQRLHFIFVFFYHLTWRKLAVTPRGSMNELAEVTTGPWVSWVRNRSFMQQMWANAKGQKEEDCTDVLCFSFSDSTLITPHSITQDSAGHSPHRTGSPALWLPADLIQWGTGRTWGGKKGIRTCISSPCSLLGRLWHGSCHVPLFLTAETPVRRSFLLWPQILWGSNAQFSTLSPYTSLNDRSSNFLI